MALRPSQHAPSRLGTGVAHWQTPPGAVHSRKGPCKRGPASVQPRSLNANTQRQGGRCFGFKRYVLGRLHCVHNKQTPQPLFAQQTNTATNSVQWTLQLLVSDARTECTGSLIRGRPARRGYRFALFSDAQGTPSLRIRVGQRGHANKCGAPRIRRRSRQHYTEASALGGPMKNRLYRDGLLRW